MKTSRWTEDLASITDALWAKRGEREILPEARDEGEEKNLFSPPLISRFALVSRFAQKLVLDSPLS